MALQIHVPRWLAVFGVAIVLAGCSSTTATRSTGVSGPASIVPSANSSAAQNTQPPVSPSPTPIAVRPGESWVLLQQFLPKATVMLVRADGTGLHSPTSGMDGGDQTNPDWSPDGSRIVFARSEGAHEDLWIVNADGTDPRLLAACVDACQNLDDPDWAPNGRMVLYSRNSADANGDEISRLEEVDVDSGKVTVIVTAKPGFFYAGQRLSPDGRSIVLEVVEQTSPKFGASIDNVTLAIIDVGSPTASGRSLTKPGTFPETAAWAPNGKEIVFGALPTPASSGHDLFAIAPDGTGLRRLTTVSDHDGSVTHPDVSPDGSWVICSATMPGLPGVIAKVPFAGGELLTGVGTTFISGFHPRFRPMT